MLLVYIGGMPPDATYGALAVRSRRQLLDVLRAAEHQLDIPALADATGLHPNTVRFHLDVLVQAGFVEERRQQRGTRGRPRMVYGPTMSGRSGDGYQLLAEVLVSHLDQTARSNDAEAAGRAWVRRIRPASPAGHGDLTAATRTVAALFTEMGFDPATTVHGRGNRIALRACPFRALADQHRAVVCGLHLGLLKETVDQASAGTVRAELLPFVRPDLCIADLATIGHGVPE